MKQRLRFGVVLALYFLVVVYVLRNASPVSFCAYCGPSPTFWWGEPLYPGPKEYRLHPTYYDLVYLMSYLAAGILLAELGCAAALKMARRFGGSMARAAGASILATLALTLPSGAVAAARVKRLV